MLRPIIMIGCGGSGQKAVRYVRDAVRRKLEHAGWEGPFPTAWQFLGIDTLTEQEDASIPYLPANDYISVSLNFPVYQGLAAALAVKFPPGGPGFMEMIGWQPNPAQVKVPLKAGAGALRAVGRAAGILSLQNIVKERLVKAFSECESGGPQLAEVSQRFGVTVPPGTATPDPLTIIVGSMAGGTGAGVLIDVVDLVRRSHQKGQFPVMVAFTPDIFGSVSTDQMTANSTAFMAEFLSAYWDDEGTDAVLIPAGVQVSKRGPHSTFLIGRKNLDGLDLGDSKNVYRAVGEALAAVATSVSVQTEFYNFITVNWGTYAPANAGGYGWQDSALAGAVSSFGSTTISIGRDRFREYLGRLLHRSAVEFLANGFEQVAAAALGDPVAKNMAGDAKIAELARTAVADFAAECGLRVGENNNQVIERFLSKEQQSAEFQSIVTSIRGALNSSAQLDLNAWRSQIASQSQEVERMSMRRAEEEVASDLRKWGSEVLNLVLVNSTEFSAKYSIPVVMKVIESLRAELLEAASQIKSEAQKSKGQAVEELAKAQRAGADGQKGRVNVTAGPVDECIKGYGRVIAYKWKAKVEEQLSLYLEALAAGLLNSITAGLMQALNRLSMLTTSQDGNPAVVALWPKNDGVVPATFAPSPVEFYLEEYSTWPARAKELLERSLGSADRDRLPNDPVQAARTLIIRGGFSKKGGTTMTPLVWVETQGDNAPRWAPGDVAEVKVGDGLEEFGERIDSWLGRPATELSRFLSEGLETYLSVKDPITGVPVADHSQRLSGFKQKLQEALNQSRPLLEIDQSMNATVHAFGIDTKLNVSGFPFGVGHPARNITAEVVQGFSHSVDDVDWIFSGGDSESVLLSSFLKYPIHPSVVTSFTQPLNQALARNTNPGLLRSSFWLWRRARVLENFIPLPDNLRRAAIRGFAIGRALGYVTAVIDPGTGSEQINKIVDSKGVHNFPRHFLTLTNKDNVLPALLESMVLTFGDAPVKGKDAFNAYGALISLGLGGGLADSFEPPEELLRFLHDGEFIYTPVDAKRAEAVQASTAEERCVNVLKFLNANIERFEKVKLQKPTGAHWREKEGAVTPTDTLTLELVNDLLDSYIEIRIAVQRIGNDEESVS